MKSVTLFILAVIDTEHTVIRSYTCYHHEDGPAPDASEANNITSIMKQMDRTKAAVRRDNGSGTEPILGEMGSKSVEKELLSSTIWTRHPSNTNRHYNTSLKAFKDLLHFGGVLDILVRICYCLWPSHTCDLLNQSDCVNHFLQ